jgi:putative CocE/NonD family hydrolase
MGLRSALIARLLDLPPARYRVQVDRDIAIAMPDGVRLMTDHYQPQARGTYPTVLVRTPYGRGREAAGAGGLSMFMARRFAERGYHVVVQTVRGRFDSEGVFRPRADDTADGRATLAWIAAQPWCNGVVGMWGMSYLGFTQWAVAADAPPVLKALVPSFTSSQAATRYFPDGAFSLLNTLAWLQVLFPPGGRPAGLFGGRAQARALAAAVGHLPMSEADTVAIGKPVDFYREWLAHPAPSDPYWANQDFSGGVPKVTAPIHLVGGWYDLFLSGLLHDYDLLCAAGRPPYLTLGPWTHTSPRGMLAALRAGMHWFATYLADPSAPARQTPVRIYLMGAGVWRDLAAWPPPTTTTQYHLRASAALALEAPPAAEPPDQYRYDPADPTPLRGGPVLLPPSGRKDQRALEARADVLCYTSPPLSADLDVVGTPRLVLYVRSTLAHTDFLGRLCDVSPRGRSINVCDGLVRVEPGKGELQPDGSLRLEIGLWTTAQRFKRGHRLRLQVASGAHARWSRNLGTGEPLAIGTRMLAADQTIYHDAAHPSALLLPVAQ